MPLVTRAIVVAAAAASVFIGSAPANAGLIDCTLGYPGTLMGNPNDPTYVAVYPQVHAHGPVGYTMHVVNGTFGYANCVL